MRKVFGGEIVEPLSDYDIDVPVVFLFWRFYGCADLVKACLKYSMS